MNHKREKTQTSNTQDIKREKNKQKQTNRLQIGWDQGWKNKKYAY